MMKWWNDEDGDDYDDENVAGGGDLARKGGETPRGRARNRNVNTNWAFRIIFQMRLRGC